MEVGKSIAPRRFKFNSKCFPSKYSSLLTNHNKKMDEWKTGFFKTTRLRTACIAVKGGGGEEIAVFMRL